MNPYLLELIILAVLALYLINKLMNTIGTTDEAENRTTNKNFFGLKDVTDSLKNSKQNKEAKNYKKLLPPHIIAEEYENDVYEELPKFCSMIPNFDFTQFIEKAEKSAIMILEALEKEDQNVINMLVDKRFESSLHTTKKNFGDISQIKISEIKISGIYIYGNNAFIKSMLLISTKQDQENIQLSQEWTYTKHIASNNPAWLLSNISTYN